MAILPERHDALIADGIAAADYRIDAGRLAGVAVVPEQAPAQGRDPHLVVGGIGECGHELALQASPAGGRRAPSCGDSSG